MYLHSYIYSLDDALTDVASWQRAVLLLHNTVPSAYFRPFLGTKDTRFSFEPRAVFLFGYLALYLLLVARDVSDARRVRVVFSYSCSLFPNTWEDVREDSFQALIVMTCS